MFRVDEIYKDWTPLRVLRHLLYWMSWLFFYALVNSSYKQNSFLVWVEIELIIMLVKLPFTYFVMYVLVPRFLRPKQYLAFLISVILLSIPGGTGIHQLNIWIINPMLGYTSSSSFWDIKIAYKMLDLIYTATIPTMIKLLQIQIQQEKKNSLLTEQKLNAELKLLKNQLQPHFLFNTLNNLYGMVLSQHPKAGDVLLHLSEMMSYMLFDSDQPKIALSKEIQHLENYMELEKIRYGKRLTLDFKVQGDIDQYKIPPLLFIPFVENAFKHGVGKSENQAWVKIQLALKNKTLDFSVENSFPNDHEAELEILYHSGIGLHNVKQRLELLFPDRYELKIQKKDCFLVKLKLELDDEMPDRR